jgi:hypothetical protein
LNQSIALLLSLIIEVPIVWWWMKSNCQRRSIEIIIIAICATVITHPWVWLFNYLLVPAFPFPLRALLLESGAIVIEAIVYKLSLGLSPKSALMLATVANLTSFGLGLTVSQFWH